MQPLRWIAAAITLAALIGLPRVTTGNSMSLLTTLFTFAVMAQAWNLLCGLTGYADLGSVVFFGLGGYATAILMTKLNAPFVGAVLAGGAVCAMFATLIGLPVMRLGRQYFAAVTLGTSQAVREIVNQWPRLTGGEAGVSLPTPQFGPSAFYYLMLILLSAFSLLAWQIRRRRETFGKASAGENEAGERSTAPLELRSTVLLYALSGFVIGLTGGIHGYWFGFIDPATVFDLGITLEVIIMVVIGGVGSAAGPLLGACILTMFSEVLGSFAPSFHLTALGVLLLLALLLIPRGLIDYVTFKSRPSWQAVRVAFGHRNP